MNSRRLRDLSSHLKNLQNQRFNDRSRGLNTPSVCYGMPANVDHLAGEWIHFQTEGLRTECVGTPRKPVAYFAGLYGGEALQAFFDLTDLDAALLFDRETYDESDWTNIGAVLARIDLVLHGHFSPGTPPSVSQEPVPGSVAQQTLSI